MTDLGGTAGDAEVRALERALARRGLALEDALHARGRVLYEVTERQQDDNVSEPLALAWGPAGLTAEWFEGVNLAWDDARRLEHDRCAGLLGPPVPPLGPPWGFWAARTERFNVLMAPWRSEHGETFGEHLVRRHGFAPCPTQAVTVRDPYTLRANRPPDSSEQES